MSSPLPPPPPRAREQLCNRYCSNKHTHTHGTLCQREQTLKGNGMKLRRVLSVAQEIMHEFCDSFFETKEELQALQEEMESP